MSDNAPKWQTRPLDCWGKFKELRNRHYLEVASAREQGKILVIGSTGAPFHILNAFGDDIIFFSGEPYGASVANNIPLSLECMAVTENHGYGRDMCGYMRNFWGSMWLDRYMFTDGPFPKPNFCLTENVCDAGHAKWYQVVAEHFGVPELIMDCPIGLPDRSDPASVERKVEYVTGQLFDCLDQVERILGRPCDDEKLIATTRIFFAVEEIWTKISLLNATVPAPLDVKTLMGILPATLNFRDKPEALALLRELYDEVQWRVANQIAALGNERIRLVTDLQAPWSALRLFRALEDRGVVWVGVWFYVLNGGNVEFAPDGTILPARTPEEVSGPMKTREDALRAWARNWVNHPCPNEMRDLKNRVSHILSFARLMKADGIIMSYNRGCPSVSQNIAEIKLLMEQADIPVTNYESNCADARDTDVAQIMKRLNAFVDLLEQPAVGRRPAAVS